jgi:hypothetical protein
MRHQHGRLRHRQGITVLNLVLLILAVVVIVVLVSRQL